MCKVPVLTEGGQDLSPEYSLRALSYLDHNMLSLLFESKKICTKILRVQLLIIHRSYKRGFLPLSNCLCCYVLYGQKINRSHSSVTRAVIFLPKVEKSQNSHPPMEQRSRNMWVIQVTWYHGLCRCL